MMTLRALAPGLCAAVVLAVVAALLGARWPGVGAPIFAIAAGIAVRSALGNIGALGPGVDFASKKVLQSGIVLLGFGVNLTVLWQAVRASAVVLIGSLVVGMAGGLLLGRLLSVGFNIRLLIA